MSRLVATERSNIGLLKSFGYGNASIALHYAKFALVFGVLGGIVGAVGGRWVGDYVAGIYANVYRIPDLGFTAGPRVYVNAILVTLLAALAGSVQAVRKAVADNPGAIGYIDRAAVDASVRVVLVVN